MLPRSPFLVEIITALLEQPQKRDYNKLHYSKKEINSANGSFRIVIFSVKKPQNEGEILEETFGDIKRTFC